MPEPQQVDPSDVVQALLDPAPSAAFSFIRIKPSGDRAEIPIRVRLLRVEENHAALINAQRYAKEKGEISKEYGDVYREAQAVELLARALCRPEKRTREDGTDYFPALFVDAKQLRASFTEPEMAQCLSMYEIVKAKFGAIEELSEDDVDRWIERLAGPLGITELCTLDSSRWPVLLHLMAKRALALGVMPSSSGSSSESDPLSSTSATGSFSELPEAKTEEGTPLPEDHVLTRDEARTMARGLLRPDQKLAVTKALDGAGDVMDDASRALDARVVKLPKE